MAYRQLSPERVQVAAVLRRMREDGHLSRESVAEILGCTVSKIGDLEVSRSAPKLAEMEKLLDLYGVHGPRRRELIESARVARKRKPRGTYNATVPQKLQRVLDLEAQATSSIYYSGELIPAILQVRSYAEATLAHHGKRSEVRTLVELRMKRHTNFMRVGRPSLRYQCILGEAALRSGIGDPAVMREQLAHLIEVNQKLQNVAVQVLPLGCGSHPLLGCTYTLHGFPKPAPDVVVTVGPSGEHFCVRPSEVARIAANFRQLKAKALGPSESAQCLRRLVKQR